MEDAELFNKFIQTDLLDDNVKLNTIIDNTQSETTKSQYIIFNDNKGNVYDLALSDHKTPRHDQDLEDTFDDMELDWLDYQEQFNDFLDIYDDLDCYYIKKVQKYDTSLFKEDVKYYSIYQAFISDCVIVKDFKFIYDNQVLKVDYLNENNTKQETKYYVEFNPLTTEKSDIALIKTLVEQTDYNIHECRRLFFKTPVFDIMTRKDLIEKINNGDLSLPMSDVKIYSLKKIMTKYFNNSLIALNEDETYYYTNFDNTEYIIGFSIFLLNERVQ